MDPRTADLMEAARELLRLSKDLNGSDHPKGPRLPSHHIIHASTALAVLAAGDHTFWSEYTPLVREVAAQEGLING